jgi:hypothetical protein
MATGFSVFPAFARDPIKFDGTPLDYRVLSRPGAILFDAPDGTAQDAVPTFSTFYVFDRIDHNGEKWLELGPNRTGSQTSWMIAERTVDWKQTIVLSFTNPAGRLPSLFFEDRAALEEFLKDEAMSTRAELFVQGIRDGNGAAGSKVVSVEPPEFVSLNDQFYMLPITDHASVRVNRRPKRIMEIASINLNEATGQNPTEPDPFDVGIMFVIDTSTSMQPYIDGTKSAVRDVLTQVKNSGTKANFSFGMIGFRSSVDLVPNLEYTTREYHPLEEKFDEAGFLSAVEGMNATSVSSHDFDEDGMSGIIRAAEASGWDAFDGRYIIYISDAGMLERVEDGAAKDATAQDMASRMENALGIQPFALFLKTRAGRAYHDDAMAQLEKLTSGLDGNAVFAIENGDVAAFSNAVASLTSALLDSVEIGSTAAAIDDCGTDRTSIECAAAEAGYAMQLAWLGRQQQTQAPDTYAAWVADFALDDPRRIALAPRVLLTRAQLNDIYVTIHAIIEAFGQSEQTAPEEFFDILQSVLARVMRDPSALPALDASQSTRAASVSDFEDLGDLLGAFLQDLPYDSDLGSLTREVWVDSGPSLRYEYIEGLKSKLSMYELYYADTASWVALNANADASEAVYPVPLEMMP